ncbi:sensor histidine kinase [Undibacterium sp. Ren11W]|uniref:sensor histidine kinase n=1 Tax=Undibacterium sp. Ren11W TaxID=3413045 RepID=UPI003BF08474
MFKNFFKHRIRNAIALGWLIFWSLMIAVALQEHLRNGGKTIWEPIFWESSSAIVGTFLLLMQRRLLTNRQLLQTPIRWFLAQLAVLPVICVLFVAIVFAIRHAVYLALGLVYQHASWGKLFLYESSKLGMFLGIFYVVIFGIQAYAALLEEKKNSEKSQSLLRQAQMHRLTQQMQPHFLFNALNTVSSLMYSDLKLADTALTQIADLLRGTLELDEQTEIPLSHELRLLQAYAKLMSLRFVDRVEISWEIADQTLTCKVPVMCLQTLLENSFKHTVERRSQLTRIRIAAHLTSTSANARQLVLSVEDDAGVLGDIMAPTSQTSGIGLNNLRLRLSALYQEQATLQISQLLPAGVRTELRLPC